MNTFEEICSQLKALDSALICTHVSPDADAIGSSFALKQGLSSLGVSAEVYLPEGVPERLQPLVEGLSSISRVDKEKRYSAVVTVDTASRARVGADVEAVMASGEKSINIDHHPSNVGWAESNYIRGSASSTALIIFEVLSALNVKVDAQTADMLFAGLLDDTGCFRFSNTDAESFECAAALVKCGASPERIGNMLYFSIPERVLRLQAGLLEDLRLELDGRVSIAGVSKELFEKCGATAEDTEGLVEIVRKIEGTVAAVFLREQEHDWKLSLRAKDSSLDVNTVAQAFDGGGHRQAAGCTIAGSRAEIEQKVLAELAKQL